MEGFQKELGSWGCISQSSGVAWSVTLLRLRAEFEMSYNVNLGLIQ